jgi:hypothetical protein
MLEWRCARGAARRPGRGCSSRPIGIASAASARAESADRSTSASRVVWRGRQGPKERYSNRSQKPKAAKRLRYSLFSFTGQIHRLRNPIHVIVAFSVWASVSRCAGPISYGVISRAGTNAAARADRDLRKTPSRIASPSTNGPRQSTPEPRAATGRVTSSFVSVHGQCSFSMSANRA